MRNIDPLCSHFFRLCAISLLIWTIIGGIGAASVSDGMAWKFRSDLSNSGIYDDGGIRPEGELLWSYTTGSWVYSSPAVVDGILYIGGNDGNIYALDAATGALVWNYTAGSGMMMATGTGKIAASNSPIDTTILQSSRPGGRIHPPQAISRNVGIVGSEESTLDEVALSNDLLWNSVHCSPAVTNGVVYVGSDDGNLYALDAATGALLWNYTTGHWVDASPTVADGVVYFGSTDNTFYALDAATGALLWSYPTGDSIYSSPAVANGRVYFGSDDGNLYALDTATGSLLWNYTTGYWVDSSPAVANGVVYVGSSDNALYALDAGTGTLLWNYTTGYWVDSSPAVANGIVYVGSGDGNLYALNAITGIPIWDYPTGDYIHSSPAVANGVVYHGSVDGNLYALEAGTGTLLWNYRTGGSVQSSPAVANGVVYVGSWDGNIHAISTLPDNPPDSVSNLHNTTYDQNSITWAWIDPTSPQFDHVMVYLNEVFQGNVTNGTQTFTATGLGPSTAYTIGTRSVGSTGLINQTWVNTTSMTAPSETGLTFKVPLNPGWNLFSTPILLEHGYSRFDQVFPVDEQEKMLVVIGWDGRAWYTPQPSDEVKPLDAYYVKIKEGKFANATIIPSHLVTTLPTRVVYSGISLIGPAPAFDSDRDTFPEMPLNQSLASIEYVGGLPGYTMVVSPSLNQPGWTYAKGGEVYNVLPFKGYWVVMENGPDTLYGFSTTPITG